MAASKDVATRAPDFQVCGHNHTSAPYSIPSSHLSLSFQFFRDSAVLPAENRILINQTICFILRSATLKALGLRRTIAVDNSSVFFEVLIRHDCYH
jgi:hypothetical protein